MGDKLKREGRGREMGKHKEISIVWGGGGGVVENEALMSPNLWRLLEDCIGVYGYGFWVV